MSDLYKYQSHRITEVFAAHGIAARPWKANVSPQFVTYSYTFALNVKLSKVKALDHELSVALGVPSVTIVEGTGAVNIEVPRAGATRLVELIDLIGRLEKSTIPVNTAVIGIDGNNAPMLVRLDSPDVAHVLIAGTTGSGKTELLVTLLISLALYNHPGHLQFVLIDPKNKKLAPLAQLPHVWRRTGIISEPEDVVTVLTALVAEMERRDRLGIRWPQLVVAIDELADLIQSAGQPVIDAIQRLTQRGRESGISVVAATQRPAATMVGGMLKANLPVRFVGAVTSTDDAKIAAGIPGSLCERMLGKGDFKAIAKGQMIRFQVAYVAKTTLPALVAVASAGQRGRKRRGRTADELNRAVREYVLPERPSRAAEESSESADARRSRERAALIAKLVDLLPQEQGAADPWAAQPGGEGAGVGQWGGVEFSTRGEIQPRDVSTPAASLPPSHIPIPTSPNGHSAPVTDAPGAHTAPRSGSSVATRALVPAPSKLARPAPRGEGSRLRDRYTPAQLYEAYLAHDCRLTAACKAKFGYSDPVALALMREAVALCERQAPAPAPDDSPAQAEPSAPPAADQPNQETST